MNIVDAPAQLSELKLSFGLQASPVKPVSQRQQRMLMSAVFPGYPPVFELFETYVGAHKNVWQASYAGLPEPADPERVLREYERVKAAGPIVTPYASFAWISLGLPEMGINEGDWYTGVPWPGTSSMGAVPQPLGLCNLQDRSFRDFHVWRLVKNWNAYGGNSVYFDLYSPWLNENPLHGQGYKSRSGKTHHLYPIRSSREISRRLYIAYRQKNPEFVIIVNAGGGLWLPMISFVDICAGQSCISGGDYLERFTYDRYRTGFYGYPQGIRQAFLPSDHLWYAEKLKADLGIAFYLIGMIINHNTEVWLKWVDRLAVQPPLRVYHGGDWSTKTFLAYWKYPQLTNLDPDKFKVSGWFDEGTQRGLLCVASLNAEAVTVPVATGSDWGHARVVALSDAYREELEGKEEKSWAQGLKYGYLASAGRISASFDKGVAQFKPYGVLMLNVR